TVRRCVRHAPGRKLLMIDDAGHYAHQERADDVTAALLDFAAGL
ncbi:MAG: alpha/beta hydrolase, partial [Rhodococcus ruber]|nr:alpha/beta hydrolase [Rhodococcus ruber]